MSMTGTDRRVVPLERDARSRPDETTPLEACLLQAAAALDRPLTLAALQAAQSAQAEGAGGVRAAITAAERAGLQAAFGARRLRDFDTTLTPAILLLEGERAVVLHEVRPEGRLAVYDPALGEDLGEIRRDALEASTRAMPSSCAASTGTTSAPPTRDRADTGSGRRSSRTGGPMRRFCWPPFWPTRCR